MSRKRFTLALLLVSVFFSVSTKLLAQAVFGSIYGTVTDKSGAAIPNATVTVTDTAKNVKQTIQTNESGNYRIDRLVPGPYAVNITAPGFAPMQTNGVIVTANAAPKVDGALDIATTSQQVVVTSAPPPLQTETAQVSDRLDQQTVSALPNLTRNFMQLQLFTPGTAWSTTSNSLSQNPQGSAGFSINGLNFGTQSWILDGTDNRDPVLGIIVINPTLDSVQGMQVLTQNYNAEFGGAAGGIVTAETRSGSNSFHGDVFFYRHSDAQQARDPFTQFQTNPLTNRYLPSNVFGQFGGSVGGPIIKDRTFFFADYQGTRQKSGQSLLLSVPTNEVRNTCLSATSTVCDLSEYLAGGARQIYNPITQTPYANNMIPNSQLSRQAVGLLSMLPAPNVAGAGVSNNYAASGFGPNNANAANIRLDDQTTHLMHTFGRYSYVRYALSGANAFGAAGGAGLGPGNFAGTDWVQNQSVATGFDLALNSRMATDFRFGLLKYQVDQNKPDTERNPQRLLAFPD
jgi:hypothetical protein